MDVGWKAVRVIQRTDPDEADSVTGAGVVAPDRDAALRTAGNVLALAAVRRRVDDLDLTLERPAHDQLRSARLKRMKLRSHADTTGNGSSARTAALLSSGSVQSGKYNRHHKISRLSCLDSDGVFYRVFLAAAVFRIMAAHFVASASDSNPKTAEYFLPIT